MQLGVELPQMSLVCDEDFPAFGDDDAVGRRTACRAAGEGVTLLGSLFGRLGGILWWIYFQLSISMPCMRSKCLRFDVTSVMPW